MQRFAGLWAVLSLIIVLPLGVLLAGAPALAGPGSAPAKAQEDLTVSYAGAAEWLDTLAPDDRTDQIRDYAVLGLADLLDLDLEPLRDALYDRSPARDPLFSGLATEQMGPGRSLYDGVDTLHILVPAGDTSEESATALDDRTIALALDDHRKDAGSDAEFAAVYRYTIDETDQTVRLSPSPVQTSASLRAAHGYRETTISGEADLARFLENTQHLSRLAVEGDDEAGYEIVAGGWSWPGLPGGRVTPADLAVLQRGYLAARGDAISVADFLTDYDTDRLDVEVEVPAGARAHAHELDAMFRALSAAGTSAQYREFLDEYAGLIVDQLLAPEAAAELQVKRATLREDEWLVELSEAMAAAFESNPLWPVLLFVAEEPFYSPAEDATEPGFSLDPAPLPTLEELVEILAASRYPALRGFEDETLALVSSPQLMSDANLLWEFAKEHERFMLDTVLQGGASDQAAELLAQADSARGGEDYAAAVNGYLDLVYAALKDREGPWTRLYTLEEGEAPLQFARYDGGLQGTGVGMTYFYTDILAKGYFYALGEGNPYGIVDGFFPNGQRSVPWSHCTQEDEKGRIWFGLNENALGFSPREIDLGSVATKVFVLATDPVDGEKEIEPSYKFGQGIRWWDRHYTAMADYEPQYHRLDQLMRWGAAISWLVELDHPLLPTPSMEGVKDDWRFYEWLAVQQDLTWTYDVPFVEVDGIETETLLRLYSEPFEECGSVWVTSGGISNPSLRRMAELAEQPRDLPTSVARAGVVESGTEYGAGEGDSAQIATLDGILRSLERVELDTASVDVQAPGRKVWSLGYVKVDVPEAAERTLQTSLTRNPDQLTWDMRVQDQALGEVSVRSADNVAEIGWQPGPLATVKRVLDHMQRLLETMSIADAVDEAFDPEDVVSGAGAYQVRVAAGGETGADAGDVWLEISGEPSAAGGELQFRLARPATDESAGQTGITWYYVRFVDAPVLAIE